MQPLELREKTDGVFMNAIRRKAASPKKDNYTIITQLALIIVLIFRIPLGYITGDKGLAYFGTANEIFFVAAGTISYGLSEAVAFHVRYRMKKEQAKSAEKTLRLALICGAAVGALFSVLFIFGGFAIAEKVMHIPLAGLSLCVMAPAIVFFILTGVFRGYFQGNGSRIPAIHSQILFTFFLFAGGLTGAAVLHSYGSKVSALLKNADYAASYGAMGACVGLLAASVFCFLHALVLYAVFKRGSKKMADRELQRNQESGLYIFRMLLGTGFMYCLYYLTFHVLPLLDQYLYFSTGEAVGTLTSSWGMYYGKCLVVIGLICGVISLFCVFPRRVSAILEREEKRFARERLGIFTHQCAAVAIPAAVFLAVFSENILSLLFKGNPGQAVPWLQLGSLIVVFYAPGALFMEILLKNRRQNYVVFVGAGALLIHIGAAILLIRVAKIGMMGVITSVILFHVLVAGAGLFLISRLFGYTQEWIKSFVFTIVISAVTGVISLLLNKLLSSIIGQGFSMLICLAAGIVIYMLLLVVTRAFREEELEEMAGGWILMKLSERLHYM